MLSLTAPTRVGKYLLQKKLGMGAHGTVYLARDEFAGREVALKFYDAGDGSDEAGFARSQFLTEASLAGRLSHPHIARIMDACSDKGLSYIVTEYVPGRNLSPYTSGHGLLPVAQVVEMGFKCSGALDYAWRNHIIHRDIKPANILLTTGTEVKVSDFGVAYIGNAERTQMSDVGSPYYTSPEQVMGKDLSHHSDMFSLGVVLYEMLSGQRPFGGKSSGEVLLKLVSAAPEPLARVRPELPGPLCDVVMHALQKNPLDRPANWAEFALDLARAGQLSALDKNIPDSEKFTALKACRMLAELEDPDVWEFVRAGIWSRLPAQKQVLREGETGDSIYLLAGGEAKVTLAGRLLNMLAAGDWFGEQPFIQRAAALRQASVETTKGCLIAEFPRAALDALSDRCQRRFTLALLQALAERLSLSNARISRMGA